MTIDYGLHTFRLLVHGCRFLTNDAIEVRGYSCQCSQPSKFTGQSFKSLYTLTYYVPSDQGLITIQQLAGYP